MCVFVFLCDTHAKLKNNNNNKKKNKWAGIQKLQETHFLEWNVCRKYFAKENNQSVSGFVAEQNLTNLLNLICTLWAVYCINDSRV